MNKTLRIVCADGNFAEALLSNLLIILIEHVKEVLLDLIQVKENAKDPAFHLQNDLIDELVS